MAKWSFAPEPSGIVVLMQEWRQEYVDVSLGPGMLETMKEACTVTLDNRGVLQQELCDPGGLSVVVLIMLKCGSQID